MMMLVAVAAAQTNDPEIRVENGSIVLSAPAGTVGVRTGNGEVVPLGGTSQATIDAMALGYNLGYSTDAAAELEAAIDELANEAGRAGDDADALYAVVSE